MHYGLHMWALSRANMGDAGTGEEVVGNRTALLARIHERHAPAAAVSANVGAARIQKSAALTSN